MKLNRTTHIIRQNDRNYLNATSDDRLISQLIKSSAEKVYAFNIPFGSMVDNETVEEMQGTYWIRVPNADNITTNDEKFSVVEL